MPDGPGRHRGAVHHENAEQQLPARQRGLHDDDEGDAGVQVRTQGEANIERREHPGRGHREQVRTPAAGRADVRADHAADARFSWFRGGYLRNASGGLRMAKSSARESTHLIAM